MMAEEGHTRLLVGIRAARARRFTAETALKFSYTVVLRRGTQVVRERSAKPLYVGSIPTRASILLFIFC
jgi:hypothetical protein